MRTKIVGLTRYTSSFEEGNGSDITKGGTIHPLVGYFWGPSCLQTRIFFGSAVSLLLTLFITSPVCATHFHINVASIQDPYFHPVSTITEQSMWGWWGGKMDPTSTKYSPQPINLWERNNQHIDAKISSICQWRPNSSFMPDQPPGEDQFLSPIIFPTSAPILSITVWNVASRQEIKKSRLGGSTLEIKGFPYSPRSLILAGNLVGA